MPGIKGRSGRKPSNKSRFIRVTFLMNPGEYNDLLMLAGSETLSAFLRMVIKQLKAQKEMRND